MDRFHTFALACSLLPPLLGPPAAEAACRCDCDGDGVVRVNDLVREIQISLGNIDASCAYTPGQVRIQELVTCVGILLRTPRCSVPSATATEIATPTETPLPSSTPTNTANDPNAASQATSLLDSIAATVCDHRWDLSTGAAGATLRCDQGRGHNGSFTLARHPSDAAALIALGSPSAKDEVSTIAGGTMYEDIRPNPCCPSLDGTISDWRWQRRCWLAVGETFDDTSFVLSPRGPSVMRAIEQSGKLDDLMSLCPDPLPTRTATPLSTPTATRTRTGTPHESRPDFRVTRASINMRGASAPCVTAFGPLDLEVCMINGGPGDGAGVLLQVRDEFYGPFEGLFVPGDSICVTIEGDFSTGLESGAITVNPDGGAREIDLSDNTFAAAVPVPTPPLLCSEAAASEAALEMLDAIQTQACGHRSPPQETSTGAALSCRSGRGHRGSFTLRRYPSVDAALAAFGIPPRDETVVEIAGGRLRELIDPCCRERITDWRWHRGCWLARGSTFDDTPLVHSPLGHVVVEAFEESGMLDDLLGLCD